ncbi:hypothetical protein [Natrinema marinum]|uniref:hypothetical protein n=1 Tax=Natrinema marinum TaxID=2961598 RepID=UPI0020C8A23D|nr:hypothetical protein [Natrinema marinum]
MEFRNWLRCPACSTAEAVSVLAYGTEVVLECYECGHTGEFTLGRDIPFQDVADGVADGGFDDGRPE